MGASSLRELGWKGIKDAIWLQARRDCVPINGTFELTPLCNFRCRMCYVRLSADELASRGRLYSTHEWVNLARQAMDMGMYQATLTGGEVLTRPDFGEIYRKFIEMGLLVSVLSNGSLVDEKTAQMFADHPPVRVRFTLYGTSNETYERLCGVRGGFDQTMCAMRLLRERGVHFDLAFTATTENIADLEAVRNIAQDFDAGLSISFGLGNSTRTEHCDADSLRLQEKDLPLPKEEPSPDAIAAARKAHELREAYPELFEGLFANCKSYRTAFFVTWDGDMECCPVLSVCHCRPFEDGFAPAWKAMLERLGALRLPQECSSCEHARTCWACPAKRATETGRPDGVPSHLCERVRQRPVSAV